jgi:hypothetical protein
MTWNPDNEAVDGLFERGYADGESIGKDIAEKLVRGGETLPSESGEIMKYLINGILLGMKKGFMDGMTVRKEEPLPVPDIVKPTAVTNTILPAVVNVAERIPTPTIGAEEPKPIAVPPPIPTKAEPEPAPTPVEDNRPSKVWKKGLDYTKTKICACGCGAIIPFYNEHGVERKYFAGHMLKRYSDARKRADAEASKNR